MSMLVEKARIFALAAHAAVGQQRKYTGEPYITHPAAVAAIMGQYTSDETLLAACWLHDVCEDTGVSNQVVKIEFGVRVAELVAMVTSPKRLPDQRRADHQAAIREHVRHADFDGKSIKLADVLHNTGSVVRLDPGFARIYIPEKLLLLEDLKGGHEDLWQRVHSQLLDALQQLEQQHALETPAP